MKNNKLTIIIITFLLLVISVLIVYFVFIQNKQEDKITISFNTNSELKVDNIEIKKGSTIILPTLEREQYTFLGWFINEELIDNSYKFTETTIINAKWEKQEELNYELIVYCSESNLCYSEKEFNDMPTEIRSMPAGEIITKIDKTKFKKIIVKTKNENAKFLVATENYFLYSDDELKIYNVKSNRTTIKDINLDSNLNDYTLYSNEEKTNIIGIGYKKNDYIGYYNIPKGISLYEGKYKASNSVENDLQQINDQRLSLKIFNFPDDDLYLLNSEKEEVLLQDKTNDGSVRYRSFGTKGKYVYVLKVSTQELSDYFKVYSNDLKPLFEENGFKGKIEESINIGDYLYILDNKVVKKYDFDGNLISSSKEYNNPKNLINRINFEDYKYPNNYILYEKDNNLILENVENDKESTIISNWDDKMNIGLHTYYTKSEANKNNSTGTSYDEGIYVSTGKLADRCDMIVNEYCYNNNKKLISYPSTTENACIAYKPLIYLYPEKEMDISVKLVNEELLTTVYPKYNGKWNVKAYPSGKLIDKNTGRELYGLYWEGKQYNTSIKNEGFVIKGENTAEFLEEKLALLGLNEREAEEFIIFWLPQMEKNNYNYIRFATAEEINNYMPLEINPKPDTLIRVFMEFKPLNEKITVQEQYLKKAQRNGFTAIEWGGTIIK